jgi:cobalt-zinc-cadmium efflux system membrane fusion protein
MNMPRNYLRATCAYAATLFVLGACQAPVQEAPSDKTTPDQVVLEPESPKLASIGVDTVRTQRDRIIATVPGAIALDEDHTVRVTSPVSGRVQELDALPGAAVQAGASLAHILSLDIPQSRAELARAQSTQSAVNAALSRTRLLFERKIVAQREMQSALNDSIQTHAELDRVRAQVRMLGDTNATDARYVLRSPITGTVIERSINPGMEVRPDIAQPLYTVSDLSHVWITGNVHERQLSEVRAGQRVIFTSDATPDQSIEATISFVSPVLDPVNRTAFVRATVANPHGTLRPATYGRLQIVAKDSTSLPVVPTMALLSEGSKTTVFVQTAPGVFDKRAVTVGRDDGQRAVITAGLVAGEMVVVTGSVFLLGESQLRR